MTPLPLKRASGVFCFNQKGDGFQRCHSRQVKARRPQASPRLAHHRPGLIFHSDRGSQYGSRAHRQMLEAEEIIFVAVNEPPLPVSFIIGMRCHFGRDSHGLLSRIVLEKQRISRARSTGLELA